MTPAKEPTRRVLVLGAAGRLGAAAVAAFAAAGWRVLAQARHQRKAADAAAQHIAVDLHDTQALVAAAQGASVVVYAVNPPYTAWDEQMLPLARAGMAVSERLNATFMLPGNVYAFGEGMPPVLRESTPEAPTTAKGRLRQQLENEMAARAEQGLRSVVIRAGDFFGPAATTQGTWIDQLIAKKLAQGKLSYPGPMDVPHAWAWLPDLAHAFVAVAERARRGELPAHVRLHFAGHTLTGRQLLDGLASAAVERGLVGASMRLKKVPMNWAPLRVAGLLVPMLRELSRMRYLYRVPHALDGQRLHALVGPLPSTPLSEALRSALPAASNTASQSKSA